MKNQAIIIIGAILLFGVLFFFFSSKSPLQSEFTKPTGFCSEKECNASLCQPMRVLDLNHISVSCELPSSTCKCAVYNYDAFYNGLGDDKNSYNPSANLYKSYDDLLTFVGGEARANPPKMQVVFVEGKMQYYSKGIVNVWPTDKYGQFHESIHFLIRYYTQPQDGWYPYLEEGLAHYGAYCHVNGDTPRCNTDKGSYADPDICVPNEGHCTGQVMDTSLVLQLRRDYDCDWEHCWKSFLQWAITEKKQKALNLKDATEELNQLTGKDIRPLLLTYGIDEKNYPGIPTFTIFYEDDVTEEQIINQNGEFTTLG